MAQVTTYEWDETNRLSAVVYPDGSREEYEYSADGLRRSKTIAAQTPEPQTTRFVWDGENLLQELSTNGEVRARYTYLAGGYGPLVSQRRLDSLGSSGAMFNVASFGSAMFNQAGSTPSTDPLSSFFGYDLSANTRFLNDAVGDVTDWYLGTAFGKEVLIAGTMKNPFRFGGAVGYYRDSSERDYVRARHLRNGRWISRDPIGFAGRDWNLYRYVRNNPVTGMDPNGTYVILIRGGPGHNPGQSAFPFLSRYITKRCKEAVFEPQYDWVMARAPGDTTRVPKATPPDSKTVYEILCQIYRWLKTKRPSSDKKGLWLYGHSYGGHIVGQIANPSSEEIAGMKARIQKEFGVSFKRYVTAVGNAADYPNHFSKVRYNLYSLAGDPQLQGRNAAAEGAVHDTLIGWWRPEFYNSRGIRTQWKEGTLFPTRANRQRFWYSGGKDRVIQGPNTPAAVPGRNGVPQNYSGPLWFDHVSFDARQGLSAVPFYRNQMITFITRYLLEGHPGCIKSRSSTKSRKQR